MSKISVIVPAYKEGENLPSLVEDLEGAISDEFEIIIANDGNSDGSIEIIRNLEAKYNNVKGLFSLERRGKTKAIVEGFRNSTGDIIVVMDADLQYLPKDVPKLIKFLNQADVVNGLRINRKDSVDRLIESKLYNSITRLFFNVDFNDSNSGLKVFKREVLNSIVPELRPGWHRFFLILANKKGYNVIEKGVIHYPREKGLSKYTSPIKLLNGFMDLLTVKVSP